MAWFLLEDQDRRQYRKGIWLRARHDANPDVHKLIKKSRMLRLLDYIEWIEIDELRSNGEVLLEVWARNLKDTVRPRYRQRYNVFHIIAKENPKWVCEADMGRGLILKESA